MEKHKIAETAENVNGVGGKESKALTKWELLYSKLKVSMPMVKQEMVDPWTNLSFTNPNHGTYKLPSACAKTNMCRA